MYFQVVKFVRCGLRMKFIILCVVQHCWGVLLFRPETGVACCIINEMLFYSTYDLLLASVSLTQKQINWIYSIWYLCVKNKAKQWLTQALDIILPCQQRLWSSKSWRKFCQSFPVHLLTLSIYTPRAFIHCEVLPNISAV